MIYIFHGEDELGRSEELARFREKLGDPTIASLNTTVLDGRKISLTDLVQACDAAPFMATRRLVIVQDFFARFAPKERGKGRNPAKDADDQPVFLEKLAPYLTRMPETTALVFVEGAPLKKGGNPALKCIPVDTRMVFWREFSPPRDADLSGWISRRVAAKGGRIDPAAASELARLVGSDLRQIDQELDKLLAHANYERSLSTTDVHLLVHASQSDNVFSLVDALGLRQRERAMSFLRQLLASGAPPLYLLSMIERQFRILLQVKEMLGQRATVAQMQAALSISHEFIVRKSMRQAQSFTMERLVAIHRHLADTELAVKSGGIEDVLALDVLVVELCG